MFLSKPITFMSDDAPAMHRVCSAIAKRRQAESNTLPAPEGWPVAKPEPPSIVLRCLWAAVVIIHLAAWIFALVLNSTAQQP